MGLATRRLEAALEVLIEQYQIQRRALLKPLGVIGDARTRPFQIVAHYCWGEVTAPVSSAADEVAAGPMSQTKTLLVVVLTHNFVRFR